MYRNTYIAIQIKNYFLLFFCISFLAITGCTAKYTKTVPDGTRVTSDSEEVVNTARALQGICNHPAEFWRCNDCFLDSHAVSCSFANDCLESGFCRKVVAE